MYFSKEISELLFKYTEEWLRNINKCSVNQYENEYNKKTKIIKLNLDRQSGHTTGALLFWIKMLETHYNVPVYYIAMKKNLLDHSRRVFNQLVLSESIADISYIDVIDFHTVSRFLSCSHTSSDFFYNKKSYKNSVVIIDTYSFLPEEFKEIIESDRNTNLFICLQ